MMRERERDENIDGKLRFVCTVLAMLLNIAHFVYQMLSYVHEGLYAGLIMRRNKQVSLFKAFLNSCISIKYPHHQSRVEYDSFNRRRVR